MSEHEITLMPFGTGIRAECSCGNRVFQDTKPSVSWAEISLAVAEHLRPQAEEMLKDVWRHVSMKDVLQAVKAIRKKQ